MTGTWFWSKKLKSWSFFKLSKNPKSNPIIPFTVCIAATIIAQKKSHASDSIQDCTWPNAASVAQKDSKKSLRRHSCDRFYEVGFFRAQTCMGKRKQLFSPFCYGSASDGRNFFLWILVRIAINICLWAHIRSQLFVTSKKLNEFSASWRSFSFLAKVERCQSKVESHTRAGVIWWIARAKDLFSPSRTEPNNLF